MPGLGRTLILLGAALLLTGLLITAVGRLPGDIVVRRPNFSFYFPVVTSILLSVVITLIFWFFRR